MSWFHRRERAALQLYGKLPLAKDYLRVGMGSEAGLALRDWLDHGYSGAGNAEPPRLVLPMRFLTGDAWGGTMQGMAWPSSDVGGLRPFPFVLCVERKRRTLLDDLEHGLGQAKLIWEQLHQTYELAQAMADGSAVLSGLRGKELDVDDGAPRALPGIDLDTWMAALWPGEERDGFNEVLAALGALRSNEDHVRLPLVGNLPLRHQVHAWIAVLTRLELLSPDQCPTAFFPRVWHGATTEAVPAFLTVFRHRPAPADANWLDAPEDHGTIGPGDLCPSAARFVAGDPQPVSENLPLLSESLRGPLTRYLARAR